MCGGLGNCGGADRHWVGPCCTGVLLYCLLFEAWCLVFLHFLFFIDERAAGSLHQPPTWRAR
jgi:hypothetical protein